MAAVTEQEKCRVSLKLLVDEKRNQVVLAEASKDFVDILFGFLTLPMGTIMRIIRNQEIADSGVMFGMYHLYQSVEDLGDDNFSKEVCKSCLLNPRNPFEHICLNLKVKIDESSPDKYYVCSRESCGSSSTNRNIWCSCGWIIQQEKLSNSGDVFLNGRISFIVSDDLQVTLNSPVSLVQQLSNLGITDMTQVTEMHVEAGVEEISSLLKCSLISKSPLTDVFLVTQGKSKNPVMPESRNLAPSICEASYAEISAYQFSMRIVLRKSTNRVLCAIVSDDVVNFLFSFLTIPLGSVMTLLHGQIGLECIDNLRKSVENLESKWLHIQKDSLLNAGVATGYTCPSQPLRIQEIECEWETLEGVCAKEKPYGRFVKPSSLFLVSDSLVVSDLYSMPCIDFLKKLNVPICDIEEQTVTIGEAEALEILKASLISFSPLTNGLKSLLKHKREE